MVRSFWFAEKVQELLDEMNYYGISEALVYHARHSGDSPVVGNEILQNEIDRFERLHGTLAILPLQTRELGTLETILEKTRKHSIRAFYVFPSEHKYLMTRTSLAALYDFTVDRNIPLFHLC